MTTVKHGTYAGWNWHMFNKVPMCMACREAQRQYQATWRAANPEARQRNNDGVKAGERAKTRLARAHSAEYRMYYKEELDAIRQQRQVAS